MKCDSHATHQGSLMVAMAATRSPRTRVMASAIIGEPVGHIAVGPAAKVGQGRGQFPVVKRLEGFQAAFQHAIDKTVIEVHAFGVDVCGHPA